MSLYISYQFSKGCLGRKLGVLDLLVCLENREENRPFAGQQHQAQFGLLTPALGLPRTLSCHKFGTIYRPM